MTARDATANHRGNAARSSGVSAAASAKWTCPSSLAVNTPSITQQWKCTWALNAPPKWQLLAGNRLGV
jgi:hypothetical protein